MPMAGAGGDAGQMTMWAIAIFIALVIIAVLICEKLHYLKHWFTWLPRRSRRNVLFHACMKVKFEIKIFGFIAMLVTFGQSYLGQICISAKAASTMLPCSRTKDLLVEVAGAPSSSWEATDPSCPKGKVQIFPSQGLHQLHFFMLILALFHVANSALTIILGRAKIRGWKEWEKETTSPDYELSNDPSRLRLPLETTFVKLHTTPWNKNPILLYTVCFFHQFYNSVHKSDYLTLRHGFITKHDPGGEFDFHKYIKRSLKDDFNAVIRTSPILCGFALMFFLLHVTGWEIYFLVSLICLAIILVVGTKLQAIITQMAIRIQDQHTLVAGIPLVQLNDQYFWFGRPDLILKLIHFVLFQNSVQIAVFLWIWWEFGLKSCFHNNFKLVIARLCLGVGVQFFCIYVTLPLYALVSQMGSRMDRSDAAIYLRRFKRDDLESGSSEAAEHQQSVEQRRGNEEEISFAKTPPLESRPNL